MSDIRGQDLTIACRNKASVIRRLPPVGIFEIPLDCEGRTRKWIFPTSRQVERYFSPNHTGGPALPPLLVLQEGEAVRTTSALGVIHLLSGNDSFLSAAKEVLEKTNVTLLKNEYTIAEIADLARRQENGGFKYQHYPWEWTLLVIPALGVIGYLWRKQRRQKTLLLNVGHRMDQHEGLMQIPLSTRHPGRSLPDIHEIPGLSSQPQSPDINRSRILTV